MVKVKQMTGLVKWFNTRRGYGFIQLVDGSDVFVHYTSIVSKDGEYRDLHEGQRVQFKLRDGKKGPVAVDVQASD